MELVSMLDLGCSSSLQKIYFYVYGIENMIKYVVPTGRVKVPVGRYVVPTGKDNVIVSAGSTKGIPAGSTILVLLDDSKDKFKFFVDEEEVTFSVDDFQTLFQLPQATENNHAEFEEPPELLTMLAFLT
ncbi:hypothetical protein Tco_0846444 [Tanacetum coccineum]